MDVPHHLYIYHPLNTSRNERFDHLLLEWIRCGGRKKGRNLQVFFKIFSKININICNFFLSLYSRQNQFVNGTALWKTRVPIFWRCYCFNQGVYCVTQFILLQVIHASFKLCIEYLSQFNLLEVWTMVWLFLLILSCNGKLQ